MSDKPDLIMKEVERCAEKLEEIMDRHDCYLTITDGILFVEKQLGSSVRAIEVQGILL